MLTANQIGGRVRDVDNYITAAHVLVPEEATSAVRLTPKELDVLRLIASGRRNDEIAMLLSSSPNTVESHARRLYRKLGVRSRSQAILRAHADGLLTSGSGLKATYRNGQPNSGRGVLGDSATLALRRMVSSLSLLMVYGELLLQYADVPARFREPLEEMLTAAHTAAPSLQLLTATTTSIQGRGAPREIG